MKTLILIDVQRDFLPGGALPVPSGDEIIPIINAILPKFDLILATCDYHPADHISFASQHPGKKPFEQIVGDFGVQDLWPDHCVQGTEGARLAANLNQERIEKIFRKGEHCLIDSYSAFYDNLHENSTGLAEYLLEKGIDEIYVAGLATDYCVLYSVLDACEEGIKTHVLVDACRGIGDTQKALDAMVQAGADLTSTLLI